MTVATSDREESAPAVTILIPAKNEAESLPALLDELVGVMGEHTFEIVVVDDGSTDQTSKVLSDLATERRWLRAVCHESSCGKSAALWSGLRIARGDVVVTVDGDGQNDPKYVPEMLATLEAGGPSCALVAGQRLRRYDSLAKQYGSKLANKVRGTLLGDKTRDTACGLKAIRRDVFLKLPYFDTMHRFFPALVMREGYDIGHVDVVDRVRVHGVSKYGIWDRLSVSIPDLFGVWWLRRRRRRIPSVIETIDHD